MSAAKKLTCSTATDWHPADIIAALKKKGTSMAAVSRKNHYAKDGLYMLWQKCWPKAQTVVAAEIGVAPWEIWPSRYETDGTPKTGYFLKTRIPTRKLGRNV